MQVQSIQSKNNYQKTNFKAYFINDAQGSFNFLWEKAKKDSALMQKIENFTNRYRNHALEIISTNEGNSYVGTGADRTLVPGSFYKILNHYTGKISGYFLSTLPDARLSRLIDRLEEDKQIFQAYELSKSYRLLTGQEKQPTITI